MLYVFPLILLSIDMYIIKKYRNESFLFMYHLKSSTNAKRINVR